MRYLLIIFFLIIPTVQAEELEPICITLEKCLPLAQQGNINEQIAVAAYYYLGTEETPQNLEKAYAWSYQAAQQGSSHAQFSVANMLDNGDGVTKNSIEAYAWYHLAAQQGDEYAQKAIAEYYYDGTDIPKDYVKAYAWYSLADQQGDNDAQKEMKVLMNIFDDKQKIEAKNFSIKLLQLYGKK